MSKRHFLIPVFILISFLSSTGLFAHTISQELEQTYINAYLPIFIVAKILPFIGLGILAFNTNVEGSILQIRWQFFVALFLGLGLGYQIHSDFTTSMMNKVGLILIGVLLIFIKNTEHKLIERAFYIFGLAIGFEYGRSFLHTESLLWFYILTLALGSVSFIILNNFRIIGNPRLQIPLNIFSLFLILSGLLLVLLS